MKEEKFKIKFSIPADYSKVFFSSLITPLSISSIHHSIKVITQLYRSPTVANNNLLLQDDMKKKEKQKNVIFGCDKSFDYFLFFSALLSLSLSLLSFSVSLLRKRSLTTMRSSIDDKISTLSSYTISRNIRWPFHNQWQFFNCILFYFKLNEKAILRGNKELHEFYVQKQNVFNLKKVSNAIIMRRRKKINKFRFFHSLSSI